MENDAVKDDCLNTKTNTDCHVTVRDVPVGFSDPVNEVLCTSSSACIHARAFQRCRPDEIEEIVRGKPKQSEHVNMYSRLSFDSWEV